MKREALDFEFREKLVPRIRIFRKRGRHVQPQVDHPGILSHGACAFTRVDAGWVSLKSSSWNDRSRSTENRTQESEG